MLLALDIEFNPFKPLLPNALFLYPLKTSKNNFLMFLGGRERMHHSVHWGIKHPSKTPPLFFTNTPLKSPNCPSSPFLAIYPLYIGFS